MKTFFRFIFLLLACFYVGSASVEAQSFFSRAMDSGGDESAVSFAEKYDGGFLVLISPDYSSHHFFLSSLNSGGLLLWTKRIDVPSNENIVPKKIIRTADSSYVILAHIVCNPFSTSRNILLMKFDENGNLLWMNSLGEPFTGFDFYPNALIELKAGGFAIAGEKVTTGMSWPFLVVADSIGDILFAKTYDTFGAVKAGATDLKQTPDGGYAVIGYRGALPFLLRTDSTGSINWIKKYSIPGVGGRFYSVCVTLDSCYTVLGYDLSGAVAYTFLMKVNDSGTVLWNKEYPFMTSFLELFPVYQVADGSYLFVSGFAYGSTSWTQRFVVVKADVNGNLIFVHRYNPSMQNVPVTMQPGSSNNCVVAGYITDTLTFEQHAFIMRTTLAPKSGECGEEDITLTQINGNFAEDTGAVAASFTGNAFPAVTIADGNISVSSLCFAVQSVDNIDPDKKYESLLFPNPSEGKVTASFYNKSDAACYLKIFDAYGKMVWQETFNAPHQTVDLDLPRGLYFYKVESEYRNIGAGKIIIQ